MQRYPAAERLAQMLTLADGADLDKAMVEWRLEYRVRVGAEPSTAEQQAARAVIEGRMRNEVPPLPPSASSSCWARLPDLEHGIPEDD